MKNNKWAIILAAVVVMVSSWAFGQGKLNGMVAYSLKKIPPALEKANKLATQGDLPNARVYLESAQKNWDMIHKDFKGKFDENHPDIVKVKKQLATVKAKVEGSVAPKKVEPPKKVVSKKLNSMVAYSLKKIPPSLEKADRLATQGDLKNAKVYLTSAQNEWDTIHKDFKGKFDENHPEIVAVRKHIAAVKAKVEGTADPSKKAPAATVTADGPTSTDPLPSTMVYEMKQFGDLGGIMELVESRQTQRAEDSLARVQNEWDTKKKWNVGKFHPEHPDVLALDAKFVEVTKAVRALRAKADDAAGNLEGVLGAIRQNAKSLEEAHEAAKWKVRKISSLISDGDGAKLLAEMAETRVPVERVNALLPTARAAATAFRKQYPDMKELEELVKDGYAARVAVEKVERFPKGWLTDMEREVKSALDEAEENIEQYGLSRLARITGSDKAMQEHAAGSAEEHVLILASLYLETIDVLLPELPKADRAALPEFVKARKDALDRAAPMRTNIAKVTAAVRKVRKDVVDAERQKLAAARFPKSKYHGGKWKDAEKVIRKAFEAKIQDKKLLKVDIYWPWEEREEAKWRNDHWEVKTYRYIGANCLTKLSSGKYMVYRMNFRNTKRGGGWGPLEQWSVGHVYEILEENIDK